ncbi:hypothetical protein DOTSEDRAFT_72135 [Dothistroma septosporum NZE10]|uniref:Uncharacterized protein n=1 Tax=Dothistroma septosporum (strain NZE10 / CBS 128990) TaxID=675120 RepID=N1PQC6_DOTSN|nr:hypothetical protein DOTSEDRAFT_72135 [Dothistroma septosporum NZE10]
MTSIFPAKSDVSFDSLLQTLKSAPAPLLPPGKAWDPTLTDKISTLYLHPALEALLHILNLDLPSAHFLVRHMQSSPEHTAMYLHGILHRIEGDMDNARAWYSDVSESEVFMGIWGTASEEEKGEVKSAEKKLPPQRKAREFLDGVEGVIKKGKGQREELERDSRKEVEGVLKFCVENFGTGRREDASEEWVQPSKEISEKGQDMVIGGEGIRQF